MTRDEVESLLGNIGNHRTRTDLETRRSCPQAIAHRGFKAQFPENSLIAFERAVKAGTNALETDLHLSRDGVIVLSHDPTLKRCYGIDSPIIEHNYSYLQTLRTLAPPHVPMARLKDLLEFMISPDARHTWLMLDIKVDNNAEDIVKGIYDVLPSVDDGTDGNGWRRRIVLGCWTLKFLPLCDKYLPGFKIAHIGFSISYARKFLERPGIAFNIFHAVLSGSRGQKFLKDARAAGSEIFTWTVNDEPGMRWGICQELDGICTDDPPKLLTLCNEYSCREWDGKKWTLQKIVEIWMFQLLAWWFSVLFRIRHDLGAEVEGEKILEEVTPGGSGL
ncbi:hypothetical protein RUND412_000872 [Rhizina undulata]